MAGVDVVAAHEAQYCENCPLRDCPFVAGFGYSQAPVLVVGSAPGETEETTGLAFTGEVGQLLRSLLSDLGFGEHDVYYTNVLKRRPVKDGKNRKPTQIECWKCGSHLVHEIVRHRPRVILAVGSVPFEFLGGKQLKVSHGLPIPIKRFAQEFKLIGTFDLSYISRKGGLLGAEGHKLLTDLEEFTEAVRQSNHE